MSKQDEDTTLFGYHVVCLIDVLGQKEKLARWAKLPDDGKITAEFIKELKATAGTVLGFRDIFIGFFEQLKKCTFPNKLVSLTVQQQEQYRRFRDCSVKVERFSDTFVFSALIANHYGDASPIPVYDVLGACCCAMLTSLATKTPVRGAVTIGAGAVLEDGSFYGPVLAEAHRLEQIAGHPRIVISSSVALFLTDQSPYSQNHNMAGLMREMAETSCSLVRQDFDGQYFVDYLGKGARDLFGGAATAQAIPMAYEFVSRESERFRVDGNSKLADRYSQVQRYFESKLPLWDILPR